MLHDEGHVTFEVETYWHSIYSRILEGTLLSQLVARLLYGVQDRKGGELGTLHYFFPAKQYQIPRSKPIRPNPNTHGYQNKLSIPCYWIEQVITILQLRQLDLLP
jgi:hypothetical protein